MNDFTIFKERITELYVHTGKSLAMISKEAGLGKNQLSRYLNDERTPNLDSVIALSEYFGVTMEYLLGIDDVSRTMTVSEDMQDVVRLYQRANEDDRRVISVILSKYEG